MRLFWLVDVMYCCLPLPSSLSLLYMWPCPPKWVTLILFMTFLFLHSCKEHSFSFQMIPKFCKSPYRFKSYWYIWLSYRVPFWRIGLSTFVLHTTVLQQLQFKMPETVIKHQIWPLKVMFSNRIMPKAPNFDENRKSIFLTCRSKILAFCIVTEYQCNWFRAVGSHMV